MANRRPKPEEIVTKLRQVEVLVGYGHGHNAVEHLVLVHTHSLDCSGNQHPPVRQQVCLQCPPVLLDY